MRGGEEDEVCGIACHCISYVSCHMWTPTPRHAWVDGWMDGSIDGWSDGWMIVIEVRQTYRQHTVAIIVVFVSVFKGVLGIVSLHYCSRQRRC